MIARKFSVIFFVVAAQILFSMNQSIAKSKKTSIKVGGFVQAAGMMMFCAKVADLVDRHVEGVSATVTTGSSGKNPMAVQKKDVCSKSHRSRSRPS